MWCRWWVIRLWARCWFWADQASGDAPWRRSEYLDLFWGYCVQVNNMFVSGLVAAVTVVVGGAVAAPAEAATVVDLSTAAAVNLGADANGQYADGAGGTFDGFGQMVIDIDGAFLQGNAAFLDASGKSKVVGESCIGQPVGRTPFPSLCSPSTMIQPSWPGSDPMYFSTLSGSAAPGNAPFNTCDDAGSLCHGFHGTATAGTIVGSPGTRYEYDGRAHRSVGAASGASVHEIKIGGGTGSTQGWPHASVVDALDWVNYVASERNAYRGRIAAVNLSVSGNPLPDGQACGAEGQAVNAAAGRLKTKGIAVVMSAGNDGISGVGSWNCGSNIVRVGATNVTTPTLTQYTQRSTAVQLYAPVGDGNFDGSNKIMVPYKTSGTFFVEGTSFAAPQAAGAYAVLREKFGAAPTVDQLTALLQHTGTPITGDAPANARNINIANALTSTP